MRARTVRAKVTLVALLVTQLCLGSTLFFRAIKDDRLAMAAVVARSVGDILQRDKEILAALSNSDFLKKAVMESNDRNAQMGPETLRSFFEARDREWARADEAGPPAEKHFAAEASARLRTIVGNMGYIGEILVSDRSGGLVAASDRTTDYYQADEPWWQASYDAGRGKIAFEELVYDISSATTGITASFPITAPGAGLVGISKYSIALEHYLENVKSFRVGATGFAVLTNADGVVLYCPGTNASSARLLPPGAWKELTGRGWSLAREICWRKGPALIVCGDVPAAVLTDNGLGWKVVVAQSVEELALPYLVFLAQTALGMICVIVLVALLAWFVSKRLTAPASALNETLKRMAEGDFDHPAATGAGDEFGEIAVSVNTLAANLAAARELSMRHIRELEEGNERLRRANDELRAAYAAQESLREQLDAQMREREQNRAEIQAAVINMMEDLQESKEAISLSMDDTCRAYEELKAAQDQLLQAEKLAAVGRFSAGIAHEVKNPLAIILGGMEYLDSKIRDDDQDAKAVIGKIKSAILRADKILKSLLRFAQPIKLHKEETDAEEFVGKVLDQFRYAFPARNIQVRVACADHGMRVSIDRGQIEQVMINLMMNALDAMPSGGAMTITVRRVVAACAIDIADTGTGITPAHLASLFEPFFTTKRERGGTGLGLAIARSIVESHGGTLTIRSEEGKGTTATIVLPLTEKR